MVRLFRSYSPLAWRIGVASEKEANKVFERYRRCRGFPTLSADPFYCPGLNPCILDARSLVTASVHPASHSLLIVFNSWSLSGRTIA